MPSPEITESSRFFDIFSLQIYQTIFFISFCYCGRKFWKGFFNTDGTRKGNTVYVVYYSGNILLKILRKMINSWVLDSEKSVHIFLFSIHSLWVNTWKHVLLLHLHECFVHANYIVRFLFTNYRILSSVKDKLHPLTVR